MDAHECTVGSGAKRKEREFHSKGYTVIHPPKVGELGMGEREPREWW